MKGIKQRMSSRLHGKHIFAVFFTVFLLSTNANAAVFASTGAFTGAVGGAIICGHIVQSYWDDVQTSDEPWYLVWHHVGVEDVAGFTAGTVCAVPGAFLGGVAGAMLDTSVVGTTAVAGIAGTSAIVARGVHVVLVQSGASRHLDKIGKPIKILGDDIQVVFLRSGISKNIQSATDAARNNFGKPLKKLDNEFQVLGNTVRQYFGKLKIGPVATSSSIRSKFMLGLYNQQRGRDALCDVPLPTLYVGLPWKRRLNPDIEIDHIIPRALGGSDDISNLQLTHRNYNRAKGTLIGQDLVKAQGKFCPI